MVDLFETNSFVQIGSTRRHSQFINATKLGSVFSSNVKTRESSGTWWVAAGEHVVTVQHKSSHSALRVTAVSDTNIPQPQP